METVKRAYVKPTILKVQLSHEQAVLGACSSVASSLANRQSWCSTSGRGCREGGNPGSDNSASS
jgi:hypothetical protein